MHLGSDLYPPLEVSKCIVLTGNLSTYGREFLVPFPHVNLTLSGSFQYTIYVTNPNSASIDVRVVSMGEALQNNTIPIASKSSASVPFNASYMMQGQGQFSRYVRLTAVFNFGVHVTTTEKMDGFTSLPVESWGTQYLAVTYCKAGDGKCQIIIIANQNAEGVLRPEIDFRLSFIIKNINVSSYFHLRWPQRLPQVSIQIMAQNSSTYNVMYTPHPAPEDKFTVTLKPLEAYQLQRPYDITGAQIYSNVSVGVLSGSSGTNVGASSSAPGAFMEFLPPEGTYGMEFVLHRTRKSSSPPDLVLIMAAQNCTVVFMSTGQQRFSLSRTQHLIRNFTDPLIHIRSDRPVVVVKFSQSDSVTPPIYPTMSVIVPISLYLPEATFVVPKMTDDDTATVQSMLVIGKNSTLSCLDITGYSLRERLNLT
ncbi:hypothetical protein Btru_053137, partial [Bulinus truncatus]